MNSPDLFKRTFGHALRLRRQAACLTQGGLAKLLESDGFRITQGYVSLLENGRRSRIPAALLLSLHRLIGLRLEDLVSPTLQELVASEHLPETDP